MTPDTADTRDLLERARAGDRAALDELFARHHEALVRAVDLRMDRRLRARAAPSDVVQEACLEAARRLPAYLERPEMPFHLWLRWIVREKLFALYRKHLGADKRDARREAPALPAESSVRLAEAALAPGPSPSQAFAAAEMVDRVRRALECLDEDDREVILLRHFEQLSNQETARLLGIGEDAASKRHVRALERLRLELRKLGVTGSG